MPSDSDAAKGANLKQAVIAKKQPPRSSSVNKRARGEAGLLEPGEENFMHLEPDGHNMLREIMAALRHITEEIRDIKLTLTSIEAKVDAAHTTSPALKGHSQRRTYLEVLQQGNEQPVTETHTSVTGKRHPKIVGNKKDTVSFEVIDLTAAPQSDIQPNPALVQQLTLPHPQPPKHMKAIPIRINQVMPRTKCPAKQWRAALREKGIIPYSIFHPYSTAVEILIPEADAEKMRQFLTEIQRTQVDPDPFLRRDGQQIPLSQDSIYKTIEARLRMLHYESNIVGVRYLQQIVVKGLSLIEESSAKQQLEENFQAVQKARLVE